MNGSNGLCQVTANTFAAVFVSNGGDRERGDGACEFDVVAWGDAIIVAALHPHVVAQIAEALIVEDKCWRPPFEVDSRGDPCGAFDGANSSPPPADPYRNHARGRWEIQVERAHSALNLQSDKIEHAQFCGNLRRSATELDPPRNGGAERNFCWCLTPEPRSHVRRE